VCIEVDRYEVGARPLEELRRRKGEEIAMATCDENTTEELRDWARDRVQLRRRLRQRTAGFVLGMLFLAPVWAVGEYLSSGGWPQRLSSNGSPGDWSPWIIWVALAWGFYVALTALALRCKQPPVDDAEIDLELARLGGKSRA
jgi:hypothetical protein